MDPAPYPFALPFTPNNWPQPFAPYFGEDAPHFLFTLCWIWIQLLREFQYSCASSVVLIIVSHFLEQ